MNALNLTELCFSMAAVGITLLSHHSHQSVETHYNEFNPGIHFECLTNNSRRTTVFGVYSNSFHRTSVYFGSRFSLFGPVSLQIQGTTGYKSPIMGFFTVSVQKNLDLIVGPKISFLGPEISNAAVWSFVLKKEIR